MFRIGRSRSAETQKIWGEVSQLGFDNEQSERKEVVKDDTYI